MSDPVDAVADELVAARRERRSLSRFPGRVPADMAEAYRIQDAAITRWPDSLVGWKIGYIAENRRAPGQPDRLVGPIWDHRCRHGDHHGLLSRLGSSPPGSLPWKPSS